MGSERGRESKALVKLIEDAIDRGATTVEGTHKAIADLPLTILEETGLLRGPAKEVKRVQDQTIGAIYDLIRSVNKRVGALASALLTEAAKRRGSRVEAEAKQHAAAKSA